MRIAVKSSLILTLQIYAWLGRKTYGGMAVIKTIKAYYTTDHEKS
jgi:hypothetical protein